MIELILDRSEKTPNPSATFYFDSWVGYPQMPQKQISYMRRLGSPHIIRQDTGYESQMQSSTTIKHFGTWADYDDFVISLTDACDYSSFYNFFDVDNNYLVFNLCLMNFQHRPRSARGGNVTGSSTGTVTVEFTINYMVDSRLETQNQATGEPGEPLPGEPVEE